jgi:hypothetical protein
MGLALARPFVLGIRIRRTSGFTPASSKAALRIER